MLDKLLNLITDGKIKTLLYDRGNWASLIVNKRKPYTYRVFTRFDDFRICLHKFDVCDTHESFFHPHPWPGAFVILEGKYKMKVGRSSDRTRPPKDVMTVILGKKSSYEIVEPLTWHSVIPLETSYSIMLNGLPWHKDIAHEKVVTTKGKDLDKMPETELFAHLQKFDDLIEEFNG